ncbi:MAG: GNAT family N-acetyltransferase [Deltaproteobacteria bacterium]|nr:GNAT family N-acetyltransferase [Deltaproteobacteria bacterium]
MTVRVRRVESEEDRKVALSLRWTVFVEEQGVPPSLEHDHHDDPKHAEAAVHVLAEVQGLKGAWTPAGAGRFIWTSPGLAKIQRMAVIDDARGQGVGLALLRALEAIAKEQGAKRFTLGAQLTARGFYEKAGYAPVGDVFMDAGIEHVKMERDA